MKTTEFVRLDEILASRESVPSGVALYASNHYPLKPDTPCAWLPIGGIIWDDEGFPVDEEGNRNEVDDIKEPAFAVANGLIYVLDHQSIEDVLSNAKEQKSNVSISELVDALNYYWENDAFIEFDEA
jgi:hypothetical protein